jgi:hypothetical protein
LVGEILGKYAVGLECSLWKGRFIGSQTKSIKVIIFREIAQDFRVSLNK